MSLETKINSKKKIEIPYWILKLLPMWEYVCPACQKEVPKNSHECSHCGEKYPLTLKVPPSLLKDPKKLEAYVHKHVFPRVSEFERNYLTKYFTVLFSDGFESNDFTAWTGTNGAPVVQQVIVHSGTHAANITSPSDWCFKQIAPISTVYLRCYFYIATLPVLGTYGTVMYITDTTGNSINSNRIYYANDLGVYNISLYTPDSTHNSYAVTLNTGQWYCGELLYDIVGGVQRFFLDGIDVLDVVNTPVNQAEYVNVGGNGGGTNWVSQIYYDDVVVADVRIYCGIATPKGTITIHAKLVGII